MHYLTFIVSFLNEILSFLKLKEKYLRVSYEYKLNVKKEFVNSLKTKTIGDIICVQRSDKYNYDLNYNENIYEKTKGNNVLKNLFSENYLIHFRKIYFKSEKLLI